MDNVEYGRCFQDKGYEVVSRVFDESDEDRCEYRLKCALSWGAENNCSCYGTDRCAVALVGQCGLSEIRYPRQAVITSFTFFPRSIDHGRERAYTEQNVALRIS